MDCSPPGSFVHGDFPGKNTGVGCHALLQGIFQTQGSNPVSWIGRWVLYHLCHLGSPLFSLLSTKKKKTLVHYRIKQMGSLKMNIKVILL